MRQLFTINLPILIIIISGIIFFLNYLNVIVFLSISFLCLLIMFTEYIVLRETEEDSQSNEITKEKKQ